MGIYMDKAEKELGEAVTVKHKEHQSDKLNWALVSHCQPRPDQGQKQYYGAVGQANRKNNSFCVWEPLEHPNSWEIGGLTLAPLNGP